MRNTREKGDFVEWLLVLLAISVVIFAILIPKSGKNLYFGLPKLDGGWSISDGGVTQGGQTRSVPRVSFGGGYSYSRSEEPVSTEYSNGAVRLSTGNAGHEDNPDLEYITIKNNGSSNLNLTGWRIGNSYKTVPIPRAAALLQPYGESVLTDVVLAPDETAVITTGKIGIAIPYRITSFRVNKCSGYLGTLPRYYNFEPNLDRQCPSILENQSVVLPKECRELIEDMPRCHNPEIGSVEDGDYCDDCVDGEDLPNACVDFVRAKQGYAGCVVDHMLDADFYGDEWRIFLGERWELWPDDSGTVSLYDAQGRLAATRSY